MLETIHYPVNKKSQYRTYVNGHILKEQILLNKLGMIFL